MKLGFKIFCSYKSLISYGLAVLTAFFLLSACAAPSKQSSGATGGSARSQVAIDEVADTEIEKLLRQEYNRWRGTKHRLGGTGSRGIDCSGFVQAVYWDVFNVDLPRTTKAQVRQGRPIPFKELRAGDLVFFQPPTYPRHVGIYLGRSEFVHASKNKGVTLSKIDKYYWGKYYWTARRILSTADLP
ncbi:MAG: NlpC/P60 family protein [Desulfobacterales bacterium]|jgi:cell wall-associated NlpC family hydrolase